jgi:hypothetical protein
MTNEQINIAIAEACGWNPPPEGMGNMTHGGGKFMSSEEWRKSHLPDYCNDLNAMHEAEKVIKINSHLWKPYESFLARIVSGDCGMFHITAKQRAEAFLKTIGKWEDAK